MTYYVYILYDLLANAGGALLLYQNDDVAIRDIHDKVAQDAHLTRHIRDYVFKCIGTYNTDTGDIKDLYVEEPPEPSQRTVLTGVQIATHIAKDN